MKFGWVRCSFITQTTERWQRSAVVYSSAEATRLYLCSLLTFISHPETFNRRKDYYRSTHNQVLVENLGIFKPPNWLKFLGRKVFRECYSFPAHFILVPRAHDPFGLRQGSRPLAGSRQRASAIAAHFCNRW